ncbi:MAG: FKBP-type peptidyl-prolyl cis-trans isomerase [Thermoleophilaceae bacterium]
MSGLWARSAAVVATGCVALAGCGGGTKTAAIPSGGGSTSTSAAPATTTETTAKPTLGKPTVPVRALAHAVGTNPKKRPTIHKPKGTPPSQLIVDDIVKGKGPAAKKGDQLTVDYSGASWSTGKEFDSSWKRKQPFTVTLGQNQVIQGWEQGLLGLKKGGRRMLVIPPDLGYGASGQPPAIGPNETLVFVIDLRKIG